MFLELAICAGLLKAWHSAGKKGNLTPEREEIYINALEYLDPEQLRKLASVFDKEGLYIQASMLRKRATLRDVSEDVKNARRSAFDKGMNSNNPEKVELLAKAFEAQTATGAAEALRMHAKNLRDAPKVEPKPDEPKPEEPKTSEVTNGAVHAN